MRPPTVFPGALPEASPVRKRRRHRYGGGLFSASLNILAVVSAALLFGWFYQQSRPADTYTLSKTAEVPAERELLLLDARGKPFARRGGCLDAPVKYSELPPHFVDALLAMEDRRFFRHFGLDPIGITRATRANLRAGRIVQGGSTITQQLAKLTYLTNAKSFDRKIEEALIVMWLEVSLTKEQILERYLNRVYFGEGCFGLRAAARRFFGRSVEDLSLAQSAYLVALIKSPAYYTSHPAELRRRERLVLEAMANDGRLNRERLAEIEPAKALVRKQQVAGAYYADWIADTVKLPDDGNTSVLPVRTHYDPALQRLADRSIEKIFKGYARGRRVSQAALVAMRPDGRVLAMSGGRDYPSSQFNRATQALRQPGSSFKSFVYLAATRAGGMPDMVVYDMPLQIGDWTPENYDKNYRGPVPLSQAFLASINTVAVRLSEAVGRENVVAAAKDLGITSRLEANPSVALGTSEVSPLELTSAYAAFAAGAYPVKPWGVASVGDGAKGKAKPPEGAGRWLLPEADTMREYLSNTVQYGTGRGARLPIIAYGKTGTSQSYRDAWFIGFAGNLVVGVWVGNDDNAPMNRVTGGNLPAMIWREFMNAALSQDRQFTPQLPTRIAGFRAEMPPNRTTPGAREALASLDIRNGWQYAGQAGSGAYWGGWGPGTPWNQPPGRGYGRAMMFGPSQQQQYAPAQGNPTYSTPRNNRWAPWERHDSPG